MTSFDTTSLSGHVITPSDHDYDATRTIWNGMIDKHPAIIVQCENADDVAHALSFGIQHALPIAVRGAGHNIAGNAVCDEGLMIDLSHMKRVQVDAAQKRARVEPGVTLHEFDAACLQHNLATPVGVNSTTGIAGLTLGGGFGWLSRLHGLTCDNLLSARVVTVEGRTITASASENDDLFWAIRGGGGNFGVVTEFEFALHPINPQVYAGLIVFPHAQAMQVLKRFRAFTQSLTESLTVMCVLRAAPPLPFLPESVHGSHVLIMPVCHFGDLEQGRKLIEPLLEFGEVLGSHLGPAPYLEWQTAFDPLLTPGARNYWKSHNFTGLHDDTLTAVIDFMGRSPSPHCEAFIPHIAGAINRVSMAATAYPARDQHYVLNVHARWEAASDDARCVQWARAMFDATKLNASPNAYVNFMTEDEAGRVEAGYGANYQRLREIKRKYDPRNVLRLNQNIPPA